MIVYLHTCIYEAIDAFHLLLPMYAEYKLDTDALFTGEIVYMSRIHESPIGAYKIGQFERLRVVASRVNPIRLAGVETLAQLELTLARHVNRFEQAGAERHGCCLEGF